MGINLLCVCLDVLKVLVFQDENKQHDKTQTQIKTLLIQASCIAKQDIGEDNSSLCTVNYDI